VHHYLRDRAFSLIELVIVVVIIGIIGAIAVPRYSAFALNAKVSSYTNEINNIIEGVYEYAQTNGGYPAHEAGFAFPTELLELFRDNPAEMGTPFGGIWRYKNQSGSVSVGSKKGSGSPDTEAMTRIDAILDDGNLNTGRFQSQGAAWYWMLVE
jgi:general secretion pathway protein G